MAFVQINPRYRDVLDALGLRTAEEFLALPGVVVSGHPDRHVMRTTLGSVTAFLKREHCVRWRQRLDSFLAGFGPVTRSQREAMTLQALEQVGIGCPEWIAFGEDGHGRAFLLLRALDNAVELRCFLHERRSAAMTERFRLARRLGSAIARLHAVGFYHADLYAKHVFVSGGGAQVYFLDWQRSQPGGIDRRRRVRDLAALDATLAEELASERERLACLETYAKSYSTGIAAGGGPRTPYSALGVAELAHAVRRQSKRLLRKGHIREARLLPSRDPQELIWLDGEALCITPEFLEALRGTIPDWLRLERTSWGDSENLRCIIRLDDGRQGILIRSRRNQLVRWLWNAFRKQPLQTPEARQAGMLFRQQRQGLAVPRLLAFGQRRSRPWRTESFLLTEAPVAADGREP
jgi:tRNA A-37 threonylcarbamoyl transferase component Bud32